MLSTKAIGSPQQATHYFFNRDDYYSKEGVLYEKPSRWYGKGAVILGLDGIVEKKQFNELLSGKLPNGDQIGQMKNGQIKHRAGFDLTFSAPKSWSIANYTTKDPIFDKLNEEAVKFTLDLIERDCAMANEYKNGQQNMVKTGNLVISLHYHRLSRELEPTDHIHAVINNITQRPDNSWRALKSDNPAKMQHEYSEGFFERGNCRKKDYGAIYRMQLAYLAKNEAGFAIKQTGETFWELEFVPQKMCEELSTRSKQIRADMSSLGTSGGKSAAISNLRTRAINRNIDREKIAESLDARIAKFPDKITIESLKTNKVIDQQPSNDIDDAKIAIDYAISHLSENNASFSKSKLLSTAMQHTFAKAGISSLMSAIDNAKEAGMINSFTKSNGDLVYVNTDYIKHEQNIVNSFNECKSSDRGIVKSDVKFNKWQKKYSPNLNIEQKQALYNVLRSSDKINAIDGNMNSGKTHLVGVLSKIALKSWYEPIVLTASQKETKDLNDKGVYNAQTVSRYLTILEGQHKNSKGNLSINSQVLIIDNAQRIGTKQYEKLSKLTKSNDIRIINLFDSRQPECFQPGNAMKLLSDAGMKVSTLKGQIKDLKNFDVEILALEGESERHEAIANKYVEITSQNNMPTAQIIVQSKISADKINSVVQSKLHENGMLGKKFDQVVYDQRYLTQAQSRLAAHYHKDDVICFNKDYKSLSIKKDEYYKIAAINKDRNTLLLQSASDQNIIWNPNEVGKEGATKTFRATTKSFYEKDRIIVTQSSKSTGLSTGQELTLISADKKILLQSKSGKIHRFNKDSHELQHINLCYSKTATQSYSDKPDYVLTEQLSNKRQTNVKQNYNAIGRTQTKALIYTDNKDKYIRTIERHNGESKPVIDLLLSKINSSIKLQTLGNSEKETLNQHINKALEKDVLINSLSKLYNKTRNGDVVRQAHLSDVLLRDSIQDLASKEAVFTRYELEASMAKKAGEFNYSIQMDKVDKSISKAIKKGQLFNCKLYDDDAFTTPNSVKLESKIVSLAQDTKNSAFEFSNDSMTDKHLQIWQEKNTKLSSSQIEAIRKITTTSNGLILVNGLAGVGKTTMLSAIKPLANDIGIKMIGIAPTNAATKELEYKGMESHTLDSYIALLSKSQKENTNDIHEKKLIVLDESSMASTSKLSSLLSLTAKSNTRLAFIGDVAQLPSVEQGKMFWFLQKAGIECTHVKDIIRQKDSPKYLDLVHKTYKGDFKYVLTSMDKSRLAFDDKAILDTMPDLNTENKEEMRLARISFMVDKLLLLTDQQRLDTRIVTPANNDRKLFNVIYRNRLQELGKLSKSEVSLQVLVQERLDRHQLCEAKNYKIGQVLKFNCNIPDSNISKNDYFTIKDIDHKNNYTSLTNKEGVDVAISMNQFTGDKSWKLNVFKVENRKMAPGEQIRWTHTFKDKNRINMQEGVIVETSMNKAIVKDKDGTSHDISFSAMEDQHWDYAYAGTAYTEQGKTAGYVGILMTSDQAYVASQPAFLVALTRAATFGFIVTDNLTQLGKRLEINTGIKTSSLESLNYFAKFSNPSYTVKDSDKDLPKTIKPKGESGHINKYNAREINNMLSQDVEKIACHLLGKPLKKNGISMSFGTKQGSLVVTTSGKYQGTFNDFDTGEKGNMISLIQLKLGLTFKEALEYAANFINYIPDQPLSKSVYDHKKEEGTRNIEFNEHQKRQMLKAQKLSSQAQEIKGTIAETYLKDVRGINLEQISKDVKFHPNLYSKCDNSYHPALLLVARNKDNQVQAVQAIYLDPLSGQKANVDIKKRTFGALKGALFNASVYDYKSENKTAIICEGPEDALSLVQANPGMDIYACLGKSNFVNVSLEKVKPFNNIVLALDNDGKPPAEMANIMQAASKIQLDTNSIWLAQPKTIKQDYNDALKLYGSTFVANIIASAVNLKTVTGESPSDSLTFREHQSKNHSKDFSTVENMNKINDTKKIKESDLEI